MEEGRNPQQRPRIDNYTNEYNNRVMISSNPNNSSSSSSLPQGIAVDFNVATPLSYPFIESQPPLQPPRLSDLSPPLRPPFQPHDPIIFPPPSLPPNSHPQPPFNPQPQAIYNFLDSDPTSCTTALLPDLNPSASDHVGGTIGSSYDTTTFTWQSGPIISSGAHANTVPVLCSDPLASGIGDENDEVAKKKAAKLRRKIKNRESAARTRANRKEYLRNLRLKYEELTRTKERLRKIKLLLRPETTKKHVLQRRSSAPF